MIRILLFITLCVLSVSATSAQIVTLQFEGTAGPVASPGSPVESFSSFSVTLNFDSSVLDSDPTANNGSFIGAITSFSMNFNDGELLGSATGGDIHVFQSVTIQTIHFRMSGLSFPDYNGDSITSLGVYFELQDSSNFLLTGSDQLPNYSIALSSPFAITNANWGNSSPPSSVFVGGFSNLTLSAIPEPSTYATILGAIGLIFIVANKRLKFGCRRKDC